jgi:hypothetical protein
MNKKDFFRVLATIVVLTMPLSALADGKFSLKLIGGWAHISSGDINPGTKAFFDWFRGGRESASGGFRALHDGLEVGGDVIFDLTPRIGIGVGGGYLRVTRAFRMDLLYPPESDISAGAIASPELTAIPIRAALYLTLPWTRRLSFHADAGPVCYLRVRYRDEWITGGHSGIIEFGNVITTSAARNAAFGFQGGLGFEYEVLRRLSLFLDARGRYARFRGLKGTSDVELFMEAPFTERGTLYYETVPWLEDSPRLTIVQSSPPDGPDGEPRQARVDLSGIGLQAGIRIRL